MKRSIAECLAGIRIRNTTPRVTNDTFANLSASVNLSLQPNVTELSIASHKVFLLFDDISKLTSDSNFSEFDQVSKSWGHLQTICGNLVIGSDVQAPIGAHSQLPTQKRQIERLSRYVVLCL